MAKVNELKNRDAEDYEEFRKWCKELIEDCEESKVNTYSDDFKALFDDE